MADAQFALMMRAQFLPGDDMQVRFRELVDTGINHLITSVQWPGMPQSLMLDELHALAEEVFPRVRRGDGETDGPRRLLECCRLRVEDVDFATNQIVIRDGKGRKDRATMLPAAVKAAPHTHLGRVREQHLADLQYGAGWVELPGALIREYPNAGRDWDGNGSFPPRVSTLIVRRASDAATTCTNPFSSEP
jgi:integrase